MSVVVFIALGFLVRVSGKGVNRSFFDVVSYWVSQLGAGRGGPDVLAFVTLLLSAWIAFAMALGWLLHRVALILLFRGHEKSKSSP